MNLNLQKQLDLSKENVLNLSKRMNFDGQKAQVAFAIDYSGSMRMLYNSGFVQKLTERLLPLGMAFDDNGAMEVYKFDNRCEQLSVDCTVNNIEKYVDKYINNGDYGGTNYAPVINAITKQHLSGAIRNPEDTRQSSGGFFSSVKKLFGGSSNTETTTTQSEYPTYVIFITDGENFDIEETSKAIIEASHHGIFFQFVGLCKSKSQSFPQLQKLDTMGGRFLDNANFFKITETEVETFTDDQFYHLLLNEYPQWLTQARSKNLIK